MGMWQNACTASVWNSIPCSWAMAPISFTGCTEPISLFAVMTEIRTVSGLMAFFSSSSFSTPSESTPTLVTENPLFSRYCAVSSMAWCSMAETMRCLPLDSSISMVPMRAQLSDSVPPEVKKISFGSALRHSAICPLAFWMAARGVLDIPWMLEGFAYSSRK